MQARSNPNRERIAPHAEPTNGRLKDITRKAIHARRLLIDTTVRQLLPYLLPEQAHQVKQCRKQVLRFNDPTASTDILVAGRCKSPWCPWCTTWDHWTRTNYQEAKIASLNPRQKPKARLIHLVFHTPQPLHHLARANPVILGCVRHAIRKTLAETYGYRVKSTDNAERRAWRELGAIFNLHAFGDTATPYPKWSPHYDILLCAHYRHKNTLHSLPNHWPETYDTTRQRYRRHLRNELLAHAQGKPGWTQDVERFLRTQFPVDFYVSKNNEKGEPGIIQNTRARAHIRYSCRPLFNLAHAKCRKDANGKPLLIYRPPQGKHAQTVHIGPPGPIFAALRAMRPWLQGEEARSYHGILHNQAYQDAVEITGHQPVHEREKSPLELQRIYTPNFNGRFHILDAPNRQRS